MRYPGPAGRRRGIAASILITMFAVSPLLADLARDARKASVVEEEGLWAMESGLELEKDKEGETWSLELGVQHVPEPFPRVSLLLEPVIWEWERPDDGPEVDGYGDTDFTVFYSIFQEGETWPGLLLGGRVKIPTATDREIGTGKADYAALVTVGKEFGELELNLELEYETFGQPGRQPEPTDAASEDEPTDVEEFFDAVGADSGESDRLKDQFAYTFAIDYGLTEHLSAVIEVFGNTEPTEAEKETNAVLFGFEYDVGISDDAEVIFEASIDTDEVITAKIGVEAKW